LKKGLFSGYTPSHHLMKIDKLYVKHDFWKSMMSDTLDLAILRTLVAAAHLGGFGRAADRVGRTQSAVSLQLRRLEAQLGRKLFVKSGRGLVPTEAGDVLLAYAQRLLVLNDEALEAVRGQGLSGRVRVGVPQDIADSILPGALARFARAHPDVVLEGRVERQETLTRLLREGGIDIALLFTEERPPEGQDLGEVALTWIAAPNWRLRSGLPVPLALLDPPCLFRKSALASLDIAGLPWRLVFGSPSLGGLWPSVRAGLAITVRVVAFCPPDLTPLDAPVLAALPKIFLKLAYSEASPPAAVVALGESLRAAVSSQTQR
jgi:DNA-binding transcriptional LysR family regulator